jgi:acyl-CoA synthetase (AMP-forming)/AMP-acid ligase II
MRLTDLLEPRADDATTPAVYFRDDVLTRDALRAGAQLLADRLVAAGVTAGQPVAVMLPNGPEVIAAMFGCWLAGGVYVPINPRLTAAEVEHMTGAVHPAIVVTTTTLADRFGDFPMIVADEHTWADPTGRSRAVPAHDGDIGLVQWTSGTTGRPRPVLMRHSGFLALLEPVLTKLTGRSGEQLARRKAPMPNLVPTSLALSAGIFTVLFAFRVGAPVAVLDGFDPTNFAEVVSRFGIRSTVLPPAAMTMLVDAAEITTLEPLRYVRSITAPLSPLQARRFRAKFGITVLNCYGQTEIGGEIVGWNAEDARSFGDSKLGAVGRPHDGVTLRIVDADGAQVGAGELGELLVRTPATSAGYADGSGLGDRVTAEGWFRTGDMGRIDAEGFLWIEGRVSDMINRGGLKVFPAEVEEVLRLSPLVADCAVVGVPDDRLGEVPWAFVVAAAADSAGPTLPALSLFARERLSPYKVPVRFVVIETLPRNEIGKVLTKDLVAAATDVGLK